MTIGQNRLGSAAKRGVDLAISVPLLLLALVLIVPLSVVIRLSDGAPAVFRQTRVGRHERQFTLLKLRTMQADTGNLPSHEAPASKITRIGTVLRRTKLDELPQLINVIWGDMSLVGPRPCLPSQINLIEARRSRGVFTVRPGITGLAQVNGLTMEQPVELADVDQSYVDNMSVPNDLLLLLKTIFGAGAGDAIS